MIGRLVAHYKITEKIGAGGMGEVFRAADSKLGRDVALKMLPAAFAQDAERMARFQREAQVLASLNHPNIGAIYGLEESADSRFLVLELIEGPTLFDRLGVGPLPQGEALGIARQIAEAVEFAHENGVVHRDLKPSNVKVMEDGRVKVLDFGLAKAMEDPVETAASGAGDPAASPAMSPSIFPTLHSPITGALTAANVILGTAAYMSPEQARGKPIDKRADIWAFGVMLWEMLTGRRLFDGETVSDILAAVLRKEPEWDILPADTPPHIRRLVRRCLARNPKERLRDMGDARILIEDVLAGDLGEGSGMRTAPAPRALWPRVLVGTGVLAAVAAAFVIGGLLAGPGESELPLRKFVLPVPDLTTSLVNGTTLAIAPDGSRVAYTSMGLLWVRDLDRVESRSLPGTEGAIAPIWSPDGEWVAYAASGKFWKIRATGGEPSILCDLRRNSAAGGGVWRADGTIVFCGGYGPILTVSSQGGDPDTLLAVDPKIEVDFHDVTGLPGDRGVVYIDHRLGDTYERIEALVDGVRHEILRHEGQKISSLCYSPSGHLVYHREPLNEGIWAVPFSPEDLKVTGKPFLAVPGGHIPQVSADGTLVHAMGARSSDSEFLIVTRDGRVEKTIGNAQAYQTLPSLSPDGRRIAVTVLGESEDVWILDIERDTQTRFTFDPGKDQSPTWSPDGKRIYYQNGETFDTAELLMRAADGTGEVARLGRGVAPRVSPDGKFLFYTFVDTTRSNNLDLYYMPLGEDGLATGEGRPFLATEAEEWGARLSPAGDYVAYSSYESERPEIYMKRFPGGDGKWQVTTAEGHSPTWSAAGDELFFAKGLDLYSVSVQTDPSLRLGAPQVLFTRERDTQTQFAGWPDGFAVFSDGRFLVVRSADVRNAGGVQGLVVTQNWFAEFRGRQ